MKKQQLTILPSKLMDENKKQNRNENNLIRLSAKTRELLHLHDNAVALTTPSGKIVTLDIFKAYLKDLKDAKQTLTADEISVVGFVTTTTYNKLGFKTSAEIKNNVWLSTDVDSVVLGSDPEFLIYEKGSDQIISASHLLGHNGLMGSDGAMAEVRPAPSIEPEVLVKNILNIFKAKEYAEIMNKYICKSSCYIRTTSRDYPVGGHLHIGNPIQVLKIELKTREFLYRTLNKILDELIAIPMVKLDGIEPGKTRRTNCTSCVTGNHGYGFFGEYRLARNGDQPVEHSRLEHRTLSGMWLTHPTIAIALLGTAKAIIDEAWLKLADNNFDMEYAFPEELRRKHIWSASFKEWDQFGFCKDMKATATSEEIITRLNQSDPASIDEEFLKTWKNKLKTFSTYNNYKEYIDLLYNILKLPFDELKAWPTIIQENWLSNKKFIINK